MSLAQSRLDIIPCVRHPYLFVIAVSVLGLAACNASTPTGTPQPTALITEYLPATATATSEVQATAEFQPPTPTPHVYTVVQNDTLFGIAARFNITLDALMAANPGVDARALSPGTQLLLPSGLGADTTPMPQITPYPVLAREPLCYTSAAGELWCLVLVSNDNVLSLENVTGYVRLLDASGNLLENVEAAPPLNVLPPGAAMPLVAYFPIAPAGWAEAEAGIASAFSVQEDAALYVRVDNIDFTWAAAAQDAKAARVQGGVALAGPASSVWVMAVAYDATGQPVGVRRWESSGELSFDFWVYSLGADIADVQVVAEAHP